MGSIIYYFQSIFIGNFFYGANVARIAKHVDRHNCFCFISNCIFNFFRINGKIIRFNINKNRAAALPKNT